MLSRGPAAVTGKLIRTATKKTTGSAGGGTAVMKPPKAPIAKSLGGTKPARTLDNQAVYSMHVLSSVGPTVDKSGHTHTHAHTHTHTHTHTHSHTHTHTNTHKHTCTCTCTRTHTYAESRAADMGSYIHSTTFPCTCGHAQAHLRMCLHGHNRLPKHPPRISTQRTHMQALF
jgi:hypothetical protein